MLFERLMRQETSLEKQQAKKNLTDSKLESTVKDLLRPVLSLIAKTRVHYRVIIKQPCELLPNHPVIYAANHHSFMDTPIICRTIPKRGYIFSGKQRLGFSDWLYFVLNGVIFVDRKNKADMAASKDASVAYLRRNSSIIMFPEGTWNLTDNALMLPMKWGIVDIAKETDAQIVPTILDYDRAEKKCYVSFGKPLLFTQENDKADAIRLLRDTMAEMRFAMFEGKGTYQRSTMDIAQEKRQIRESIAEYPSIQWEYESSCIYHPHTEPEEAFSHLNQINPSCRNAFLFNKRIK